MNTLDTYTGLAFKCFQLYLHREKKEGDDLDSLIQKAEKSKDKPGHSAFVELEEEVTIKVSMNMSGTIFVKFVQNNYKKEKIEIAEFFLDKDKKFTIKGVKRKDSIATNLETLFLQEIKLAKK